MASVQRPLSPWAERFRHGVPGREELLNDGINHSGLAPRAPALHPIYYADAPPPDGNPQTLAELDSIFFTESFQRAYLRGLESWQAGPLMQFVYFSGKTGVMSGGHLMADAEPKQPISGSTPETHQDVSLRIFHSERIQVDESKWFSFFRKDRWYDRIHPEPALGGANWSVDNPQVWDVIRISIELVNRMLRALIEDKHEMMETILYGILMPWDQLHQTPPPYKGAHYIFSRAFLQKKSQGQPWANPLDFVAQYTPADWIQRLEDLMTYQTWSMVEDYDLLPGSWGVTVLSKRGLILLDVGPIRRLISTELTLSERCTLHFLLAVTRC
ncbi:hypothetical protein ONZ43_g4163 [Nemania bipapillata]|uniref:Uncharacterized protein n=1 Tax=Nemania bipapillata TaxID=110536 RepID=A0ACC2IRG6_9PEZI|nr:hypothetical protein ONZ43_g4163 [Nemania bipapillata]